MTEKLIWKYIIKRMLSIILMALLTVSGVVTIQEFKDYLAGVMLIVSGLGLFIYKLLTWKRYGLDTV